VEKTSKAIDSRCARGAESRLQHRNNVNHTITSADIVNYLDDHQEKVNSAKSLSVLEREKCYLSSGLRRK
jgi:hypothetical protein